MERECPATMSGRHMFTPKRIGPNLRRSGIDGPTLYTELSCICGAEPSDPGEVRAELRTVARLRGEMRWGFERDAGQPRLIPDA